MKLIQAQFELSAMAECDQCDYDFNLFGIDRLTEDGYLYKLLLEGEEFGVPDNGEPVECECPSCGKELSIDVVY